MPTGAANRTRRTAAERRTMEAARERAALDAAIAALPPGWAAGEAERLAAAEHALRSDRTVRSYDHAEARYATEAEAWAVARLLRTSGHPSTSVAWMVALLTPDQPALPYRVTVR